MSAGSSLPGYEHSDGDLPSALAPATAAAAIVVVDGDEDSESDGDDADDDANGDSNIRGALVDGPAAASIFL